MIYNDEYRGLDDLGDAVDRTAKALGEIADKFDFIAVRGCSGMVVGAPVALRLNKPLVIVRKPEEDSHSFGRSVINAQNAHGRYIFLDDFIASGATHRAVQEMLSLFDDASEVGTYEYCSGRSSFDLRTYAGKLEMFELDEVAA